MASNNQRLLEGEVIDDGDAAELDRLRGAVDRLTRERDALRTENADLRRRVNDAALSRLRGQLEPLYQALRGVFGELDEIAPDAAPQQPSASSVCAKPSPVWDSWKERLAGAPAKIIDALLMHGAATVEQLVVLTQISRKQTIYDAIHRMNKAGLIDKNGGRFALKKLA